VNTSPLPRGLKFLYEIASHLVPESIHLGTSEYMTKKQAQDNNDFGWHSLPSEAATTDLCPRCQKPLDTRRAALSRTDNETKVCEPCGLFEALEAMNGRLRSQADWPINH
jgi:predicted RNA-binding Zn-ribbon protein involved in translation (DUF1610 family)